MVFFIAMSCLLDVDSRFFNSVEIVEEEALVSAKEGSWAEEAFWAVAEEACRADKASLAEASRAAEACWAVAEEACRADKASLSEASRAAEACWAVAEEAFWAIAEEACRADKASLLEASRAAEACWAVAEEAFLAELSFVRTGVKSVTIVQLLSGSNGGKKASPYFAGILLFVIPTRRPP